MHIKLITTGGTIGSSANDTGTLDTKKTDQSMPLIEQLYETQPSYRELVEFNIATPIDTLSENMTYDLWNVLIAHLKTIRKNDADGIIITHGTDTVAYMANLLALLFDKTDFPVFLISSGKPLSDKSANGYENFNKAVDMFIQGCEPGVYVPFKNKDGKMIVHSGDRLIQCRDLSPDFESAHHKLNNIKKIKKMLADDGKIVLDKPMLDQMDRIRGNILTITPRPGLDYTNYDLDYVNAVLHGTYHASTMAVDTANSNNSILYLKEKCDKKGISLYFAPILSSRNQLYSSTYQSVKQGVVPIYDMTFEMAYMYLIMKYSDFNR